MYFGSSWKVCRQSDSSTTQNYLQYKNGFLLLETDQRDEKVLQAIRNELKQHWHNVLLVYR
jgi:hypothetical protein